MKKDNSEYKLLPKSLLEFGPRFGKVWTYTDNLLITKRYTGISDRVGFLRIVFACYSEKKLNNLRPLNKTKQFLLFIHRISDIQGLKATDI